MCRFSAEPMNKLFGEKLVVSTTRTFPSHLPRESPLHCRMSCERCGRPSRGMIRADRKSTRLNSSHDQISYAVFCLKKKKKATTRYAAPERKDTSTHRS